MNKLESIISILEGMEPTDVLVVWNEYATEHQMFDSVVYDNNETFFSLNFDGDVLGAVRACCYGDYNYTDAFVRIDGMGNLESYGEASTAIADLVDYEALAKYIAATDFNDFCQVWIDDLIADFIDYAVDMYGLYFDEQYDFGDLNLVTGDWDEWLLIYQEKLPEVLD